MRLFPIVASTVTNLNKVDPAIVRQLDAKGISLISFQSLPHFFNIPQIDLLSHFTFFAELDVGTYKLLTQCNSLRVLFVQDLLDIDEVQFLIVGNMKQWLDTIEMCCAIEEQDFELRKILNTIYKYFEGLGYRRFNITDCGDGTFLVSQLYKNRALGFK